MKPVNLLFMLLLCVAVCKAQEAVSDGESLRELKKFKPRFGVKLGYNVARLSGSAVHFSPESQGGFNASIFYSPLSKGLGYRTEIVFSRQGFSFDGDGKMQNVRQDYIYMPHLTTFTIARVVQLQAGGQIGYLLNAKKEATSETANEEQLTGFMNRIDYGALVGLEVYPYKGIIVGSRYNISMGSPYKQGAAASGSVTPIPLPLPVNPADFKGKSAVIQFFLGYRF